MIAKKEIVVLLFAITTIAAAGDDLVATQSDVQSTPTIKLDKNLRRALLKALVDLEAESAERQGQEEKEEEHDEDDKDVEDTTNPDFDIEKKDLNKDFGTLNKFVYEGFPKDRDLPSEDKLQNSSYVTIEKYVTPNLPPSTIATASKFIDYTKLVDANSGNSTTRSTISNEVKYGQIESRSLDSSSISFTSKNFDDKKSKASFSETLSMSASNGIASANSLVQPTLNISSPAVMPMLHSPVKTNSTTTTKIETAEEVKIFQAPLVAAFTVQQDEQGIPRSVVPIYRPSGDGQALTLQEQLEFKQKLLEKQLVELQQQQLQQTRFLIQQQQLYEHQLKQKQQHQLYLQEQTKLKQLQEQTRLKQLEEQRRLKQLEEQRLYHQQLQQKLTQQLQEHIQQQVQQQQKKPFVIEQGNQLALQSSFQSTNVRLQPSLSLEVPNVANPPPFKTISQDQSRSPLFRSAHQIQQRPQQNFLPFNGDYHTVPGPTRFHRQETFGSVGNLGLNVDKSNTKSNFGFGVQHRSPQNFQPTYKPFNQNGLARFPPPPLTTSTPAKQIQQLLYQSGIAGEFRGNHGITGQEDLNILSKVLALNVGALPTNGLQVSSNHPTPSFVKLPSAA